MGRRRHTLCEDCWQSGVNIVCHIRDQPCGKPDFDVEDRNGYRLCLAAIRSGEEQKAAVIEQVDGGRSVSTFNRPL
jgi:hypothetical protein